MFLQNGIKAVFYDLDGTLRHSDPPVQTFLADHAVTLGLSIAPDDRLRAMRWEHRYFAESDELHADRLDFPELDAFWNNFGHRQLMALGASSALANELLPRLQEHLRANYHPTDVLLPDVVPTLKTLRQAGITLGVISNRDEPLRNYLSEIGLGEYFDFSLAAGEVQAWKPDQAVFAHALQRTGFRAEQAVYVGDNYFADVVGARNSGLKPVLLDIHAIFDRPGCPVIRSHSELLDLLQQEEDAWAENRDEIHPL